MILAVADAADPDNERCLDLLEEHAGRLVTTALVVAEAGWLIERQLGAGAEAAFYSPIAAGDLSVESLTAADWQRVAELVERYADLRPGGVDARLVAIAERLDLPDIATLDHRDFRAVRPRHIDAFTLLP